MKRFFKLYVFIMVVLVIGVTVLPFLREVNFQKSGQNHVDYVSLKKVVKNNKNVSLSKVDVLAFDSSSDVTDDPGLKLSDNFSSIEVPVLMYHHIRVYNNSNDPIGEGLSVTPANFDQQLSDISKFGYNVVTFNNLCNYIQSGKELPQKPIILSFDDGYDDNYLNAYPILQKHNMVGVFAVITGSIGNPAFMNWDQIKEMKKYGNQIVSHTVSHPDLTKITDQRLNYEFSESKKILDTILGQNTKVIIYPSGRFNAHVEEVAKNNGYLIGRTTRYGTNIQKDSLMEINTVRMTNGSRIS